MLVAEAAAEATAAAGDLGGVESRFLQLGHLHADGAEGLEEVLAAALATADFEIGDEAGLVAVADLAHVDAGVVFVCQVANEIAEVDAIVGHEVEDDALAAEELLAGDELHGDFSLADELAGEVELFVAFFVELAVFEEVGGGGDAEDAAILQAEEVGA